MIRSSFTIEDVLAITSRYRSNTSSPLVKAENRLKFIDPPLVKLTAVNNIGSVICGGVIEASGLLVYVNPVNPESTSCGIKSHSSKATGLVNDHVFIQTLIVKSENYVYLFHSIAVSGIIQGIIDHLLFIERIVEFWSSLSPRLSSLVPPKLPSCMIIPIKQ